MAKITASLRASLSWIGLVGWLTALIRPINAGLSMAGDVDLLANYLGPIGKFLDTGLGTLTSITIGATIIGYAIYQRDKHEPIATNQKGAAEPAVPLDSNRYMTAYEALHYLADDSEWGNNTRRDVGADGMRKSALLEAPGEFKRIAEQGTIHAFGRLNGIGQHITIPETFWMTATLSPFSLYNRDVSETISATPNPDGLQHYKNLRIVREDVERIWPRCTTIATRIPLLDLLHEAEASGWSLQRRDVSQRFAQGLRQAGAEGAIEIWGLDLKKGWDLKSAPRIYTSERIASAYFKDHWIEVQQALTHQCNAYTRTSRPAGNEPRFFADLYVDRLRALEWLRSKGLLLRDTVKD